MNNILDMKKQKVYLQRDTDQYRIGGKFTILQTMFTVILVSSIILIVHKFFF